jgi:hypothetical protein
MYRRDSRDHARVSQLRAIPPRAKAPPTVLERDEELAALDGALAATRGAVGA